MRPHRILSAFPFKSSLCTILVSFCLFQFKPSLDPTRTLIPHQTRISRNNYVVRFREYKTAEDHRSYLKSAIQLDGGWEWIERKNPAAKYPTDFGLISVEESVKRGLIEKIERLNLVKDVNVDLSYQRRLLGGALEDGKKRPGKIFTSMSFNEGEYHKPSTSNSTINWRRQLLMQRSQITSLFGADVLWGKGYTGAKVKMAIFDTGIRENHPHFRNIKERTNWTNEDSLNDNIGQGTFVAGVVAG